MRGVSFSAVRRRSRPRFRRGDLHFVTNSLTSPTVRTVSFTFASILPVVDRGTIQTAMEQPLTLDGLIRFHRENIAPEFQRIAAALDEHTQFHRDTHSHLDAIYRKLDRLETEYQSIRAAIDRLERGLATRRE